MAEKGFLSSREEFGEDRRQRVDWLQNSASQREAENRDPVRCMFCTADMLDTLVDGGHVIQLRRRTVGRALRGTGDGVMKTVWVSAGGNVNCGRWHVRYPS